jgi:hypothetical protein
MAEWWFCNKWAAAAMMMMMMMMTQLAGRSQSIPHEYTTAARLPLSVRQ